MDLSYQISACVAYFKKDVLARISMLKQKFETYYSKLQYMDKRLDSGIAFYHKQKPISRARVERTILRVLKKNSAAVDEIFLTREITVDNIDLDSAAKQVGDIVLTVARLVAKMLCDDIINDRPAMEVIFKMVRAKVAC